MAIERLELQVSLREGRGKSVTRKLRMAGQIPAVIYGAGIEPTAIVVEHMALAKVLRGGVNALIDLKGDKAVEGKPVLVKEIQRDPLSRKVCLLYTSPSPRDS